MSNQTTFSEPNPAAAHPALRLAELVVAMIEGIAALLPRRRLFWPFGRSLRDDLLLFARDFAALMARLATAPPPVPTTTIPTGTAAPKPATRRSRARSPSRAVRRPTRAPRAIIRAPRPLRAFPDAPLGTPAIARPCAHTAQRAAARAPPSRISCLSESSYRALFVTY